MCSDNALPLLAGCRLPPALPFIQSCKSEFVHNRQNVSAFNRVQRAILLRAITYSRDFFTLYYFPRIRLRIYCGLILSYGCCTEVPTRQSYPLRGQFYLDILIDLIVKKKKRNFLRFVTVTPITMNTLGTQSFCYTSTESTRNTSLKSFI